MRKKETAEKDRLFQHGPLQRNETNSLTLEEDDGQACKRTFGGSAVRNPMAKESRQCSEDAGIGAKEVATTKQSAKAATRVRTRLFV
jgi:hypothetical protein